MSTETLQKLLNSRSEQVILNREYYSSLLSQISEIKIFRLLILVTLVTATLPLPPTLRKRVCILKNLEKMGCFKPEKGAKNNAIWYKLGHYCLLMRCF